VSYSDGFEHRICVDLSVVALAAARQNVGEKGIYAVGDITNLPFEDDSLDGVVSLHTIYHVPRDEQPVAFREIYRVLKPGASAVIVYFWQTTPWRNRSAAIRTVLLPSRALRRVVRLARTTTVRLRPGTSEAPRSAAGEPGLYFHAHDYQWFVHQDWPFRVEILVWSSVDSAFLRKYVRPRLLGKHVLKVVYWLEESFPRLAGRVGKYPMLVIRKS
jgi:SAM-dependent methyltransferase